MASLAATPSSLGRNGLAFQLLMPSLMTTRGFCGSIVGMKTPLRLILLALALVAVVAGVVLLVAWRKQHQPDGPTLTLDLGRGVKLELVRIEPGEFAMGSEEVEEGHDPSESPRHGVRIAKAFYIGKFEVTQGQYAEVIGVNQSQHKGDANAAIDSIAWIDAQKFCTYAGERSKRVFRLPSEAEWEYCCRAGSKTAYATGDKLTPADAVFKWRGMEGVDESLTNPDRPAIVGSKKPNAWGLYDMHGNLWEWCQDTFSNDYTSHSGRQEAVTVPGKDVMYVRRGGSWKNSAPECRSAVRFAGNSDTRSDELGFRVVVEAK